MVRTHLKMEMMPFSLNANLIIFVLDFARPTIEVTPRSTRSKPREGRPLKDSKVAGKVISKNHDARIAKKQTERKTGAASPARKRASAPSPEESVVGTDCQKAILEQEDDGKSPIYICIHCN